MTATCPLYRIHTFTFGDNTINPSQQVNPQFTSSPWCAHAHSPVTKRVLMTQVGAHCLLTCHADPALCQVPPELR